jgi:hypothetical protein
MMYAVLTLAERAAETRRVVSASSRSACLEERERRVPIPYDGVFFPRPFC